MCLRQLYFQISRKKKKKYEILIQSHVLDLIRGCVKTKFLNKKFNQRKYVRHHFLGDKKSLNNVMTFQKLVSEETPFDLSRHSSSDRDAFIFLTNLLCYTRVLARVC